MKKLKLHDFICIIFIMIGVIAAFLTADVFTGIITLSSWIICTVLYFIPCIICENKSFYNQVFTLNFFLGWSFIGWIIALIWALKQEK